VELRSGSPEEAGLVPERIELVKKRCREWVADGTHPALVVLVARHGVIALHEAFGRLGPEPDAPAVRLDSIFPLSSLTKPITATTVMALVEDGLIGLTRPVQEYMPDFVRGEDVCVHHLLTHTSGISDDDDVAFIMSNWGATDLPPTPDDIDPILHRQLVLGGRSPLRMKPGVEMLYSNGNFIALGEIIRAVTGRSVGDVARERVFGPLGMRDTDYVMAADASDRVVRRAPEWDPLAGFSVFEAVLHAAAAAHSTAMDMAVFGQALLNGGTYGNARILSRQSVSEMMRDQIPGVGATLGALHVDEASWSFGWGVSSTQKWPGFPVLPVGTVHHGGASGTFLCFDPANDMVAVFLSVARMQPVEGSLLGELVWSVDLFTNAVYAAVE
jgi:CubicO group peptidase (beta-lactamase class C family)